MTEHFTQAGMKDLCGDLGLSFYPRYFSDDDLTDLCNALANAKAAPVTIAERYALRPRWVTSSSAQQGQKGGE